MKKRYRIPYYYDEADESYPIKYLNDLPGVSFGVVGYPNTVDGVPIDAVCDVTATAAQHAELASHDDVDVLESA